MNSNQLMSALETLLINTKFKIYGILSPKNIECLLSNKSPAVYIINTEDYPGKHWLVAYTENGKNYEIFDSFGNELRVYHKRFEVIQKLINTESCIEYQSDISNVCGQFVLYFIYFRVRGYSFTKIIQRFDIRNKIYNDTLVKTFYDKCIKPHVIEKIYDIACLGCDYKKNC